MLFLRIFSENLEALQQEKEEMESQMQNHIMEIQQNLVQVEKDRDIAIAKVERFQAIKVEVENRMSQLHEQNSALSEGNLFVNFH